MRSQLKALSESRFLRSKQAVKTTKISLFPSNIFQEDEKPAVGETFQQLFKLLLY